MSAPQVVENNGQRYFVCDYTGALVKGRYSIPEGDERHGTYATLPILLRAVVDNGADPEEFMEVKEKVMAHYNQPDIPIQPKLPLRPLGINMDLAGYLSQVDQGQSWFILPGKEMAEDYEPPQEGKRKRKSDFIEPAEIRKKGTGLYYSLPQGIYLITMDKVKALKDVSQVVRKIAELQTETMGIFASAFERNFLVSTVTLEKTSPLLSAWFHASLGPEGLLFVGKKSEFAQPTNESNL